MARVSRGVTARARHKKVLKRAKGYYGRRKNVFRVAVQAVERGMQYAYRDRRKRKSDFRGLWIQRINGKILAELAVNQPDAFKALVEKAQSAS